MDQAKRYSSTAMALHWGIALLIAFAYGLGQRTEVLPRGEALFAVFQLHKSIGITILLLSLWRLAIRVRGKGHPPPVEGNPLAHWLAKIVHWLFYVIMIGVPLSGWLIVSTGKTKVPTLLYGVIPWPNLPVSGAGLHDAAEGAHVFMATIGLPLLLLLHVAGAVRHQILLREPLVERMTPLRRAGGLTIAALFLSVFGMSLIGRLVPVAETLSGVGTVPAKTVDTAAPSATPTQPAAPAAVAPTKAEEKATVDEVEGDEPPEISTKWTVAPGGRLGFSLPVSGQQVNGRFSRWTATIDMDPEAPEGGSIRASVDLASVASGDGERDAMMAGGDFFATAAHPRATFVSNAISKRGGDRYQAKGTLTIKGVAKPLTLPFTLAIAGDTAKVSGSARFDRRSFNIGEGQFSGTEEIGGDVTVTINFQARRA